MIISNFYSLVDSYGRSNWCDDVIFHIHNKETFCELVRDVKYWCKATSKVLAQYYLDEFKENI